METDFLTMAVSASALQWNSFRGPIPYSLHKNKLLSYDLCLFPCLFLYCRGLVYQAMAEDGGEFIDGNGEFQMDENGENIVPDSGENVTTRGAFRLCCPLI